MGKWLSLKLWSERWRWRWGRRRWRWWKEEERGGNRVGNDSGEVQIPEATRTWRERTLGGR